MTYSVDYALTSNSGSLDLYIQHTIDFKLIGLILLGAYIVYLFATKKIVISFSENYADERKETTHEQIIKPDKDDIKL